MSNGMYSEVLLRHAKTPAGAGKVPRGTEDAEEINPACGDEVRVKLTWENDRLARVCHEIHGCAVCKASASMAARLLSGKGRAEVERVVTMVEAALGKTPLTEAEWGDLHAFNGIEAFPSRVHCAKLVWRALLQALKG